MMGFWLDCNNGIIMVDNTYNLLEWDYDGNNDGNNHYPRPQRVNLIIIDYNGDEYNCHL